MCLTSQLYKSAILPNLTYCHLVWHFCKASDARKLERVQERALRAVYNDKNATYEELLKKGRLSSLENRRLQDILILMYKVKHSLVPEHVCKIFFQQDKHYNLRSDFPVPRYNTVKVIPGFCIAHSYWARFLRHQRAHMGARAYKT